MLFKEAPFRSAPEWPIRDSVVPECSGVAFRDSVVPECSGVVFRNSVVPECSGISKTASAVGDGSRDRLGVPRPVNVSKWREYGTRRRYMSIGGRRYPTTRVHKQRLAAHPSDVRGTVWS